MPTYGLTPEGFVPKTLTDIKAELEAAFRAAYGASINLKTRANFEQLIGILSERFAEVWEVGQTIYAAFDPDAAEGEALVALCALTGTIPNPASNSTVDIIATGTNGTVLLAGRVVSVETIGTRFVTLANATLASASAWTSSTAYGVDAVVTNDGNIYICASAGTSAGSGGPQDDDAEITDNTVTWRFMGAGTAYARIACESEDTGPKIAATQTLNVIETSVSGWSAVSNPEDATEGENAENDVELRLRREDELLGASRSVIDAIRTRVLEDVPDAYGVIVFVNDTEATNGDGLPPHSVEVLVRGGDDDVIREVIYRNVAGGITMFGNTNGTYTDADNGGQTFDVDFSRPTEKNIWVVANVQKDPLVFPADGATQIRDAILAYGDSFPTGKDVHSSALKAQCFKVAGVLNVPTLYIGTSAAPGTETSVTNALRELAVFDTARITVNVSDAVP